jgi:hypothetical protein
MEPRQSTKKGDKMVGTFRIGAIIIEIITLALIIIGVCSIASKFITVNISSKNREIEMDGRPKDYRYSISITDPDGRRLGQSKAYGTAGLTATGTLFKNAEDGKIYELTENGNIRVYK